MTRLERARRSPPPTQAEKKQVEEEEGTSPPAQLSDLKQTRGKHVKKGKKKTTKGKGKKEQDKKGKPDDEVGGRNAHSSDEDDDDEEEGVEHEEERSSSSEEEGDGEENSCMRSREDDAEEEEEEEEEKHPTQEEKIGGFFLLRRHRRRKEEKRRASLSHQPIRPKSSEETEAHCVVRLKHSKSGESTPISSPPSPTQRRRKNSLGSFGYGVVSQAGRRRAVTDSDLIITERSDIDMPQSTTERIEAAVNRWKSGHAGRELVSSRGRKDVKRKKKDARNLSKSAPIARIVVSDDDAEDNDDDDENDEDEDTEDEDEDEEVDEEEGKNEQIERTYTERSRSRENNVEEERMHVDVTFVEAKNLLLLNKRAMRKLFKYKLFAPSFTVSVGQTTARTKRTWTTSPTYEHDMTFSYLEQDDSVLLIKLFYCYRNKPHRIRRLHVGTVEFSLNDLEEDQLHDLWLPIAPTCDYQVLWDWRKPSKHESLTSPRVLTKHTDRSKIRLGSVHLKIHKTLDPRAGALSNLGIPSLAVPLRLKVGDVILFHCSQFASHGAKIATRSRWDHVAMVAKHKQRDGLYLFEATRDGVHLFHLDRRLAFYLESRTELGIRRLHTERTAEMKDALHDFIAEVEGRPYKTNPLELFRALRDSNENDNLDTIFCSQLVAAAYQRMGILSMDLCSNNYLPADFATSKIEEHLIGAELGRMLMVPAGQQKVDLGGAALGTGFGMGSAAGSAPGSFQIGSFPF